MSTAGQRHRQWMYQRLSVLLRHCASHGLLAEGFKVAHLRFFRDLGVERPTRFFFTLHLRQIDRGFLVEVVESSPRLLTPARHPQDHRVAV